MEEADLLCDRILIMNRGKIVTDELPLGFISKLWENLGKMESELSPLKESVFSRFCAPR
jgi:ABC-type multidrug transport system ATPase subunit